MLWVFFEWYKTQIENHGQAAGWGWLPSNDGVPHLPNCTASGSCRGTNRWLQWHWRSRSWQMLQIPKPCYIPAKKWFVIQTNTAIKNSGTSHQKQGYQKQNALIFSDASKKPLLIAFQEVHCSSDIQAPVVRDAGKNWHCIAMACLSCQFRFNNNHVESESTPNPNQIPWVMLKSTWLVQKSSMFSSSPKFVYRRKWTPKVPTPIETLHVVFYAGQVAVRKAHISNAIATHLTLPPYPESTMISAGWPKMVCMTLNELMWEYTSAGWPWHWQKIDFQA